MIDVPRAAERLLHVMRKRAPPLDDGVLDEVTDPALRISSRAPCRFDRPAEYVQRPHTRAIIAMTPQVAIVPSSASRAGRPRNAKPIPKPMVAIASMLTEKVRLSISQRSQLPAAFFRPMPCMVLAPCGQRTDTPQQRSVRPVPYPDHASAQRQDDCLDQKLAPDIRLPRPQGSPNPDLEPAFAHRDEHHVHVAD